ncbi:MAG: helix-turn-helix domain-containing protein [Treponema sp.]|uniref:helix-turn-helix domain-containing protein n=1 Tax=Treponema sp. TaxID=166 RepID=UPI001C1D2AD0|nr:helix-turn-helix transcriptional regulator [Treponema sp.]MBQ9283367.1 helix-turn-helix domain-containing protein [Treponema sp.]MBR1537288.1 helix-turn-helix domain-containing protein [Treponema sp.]MBR1715804.1 helix-turn-helix domain-containing protein [Treponema sp.]
MPDSLETESEEIKDLRKTLSDNIRSYRKELHLTQEQLAENADISFSYLADIEHCKTWISDKTLLKLAKALHKQPFELLIVQKPENGKTDLHLISDIIYEEKKELVKTVSEICDKTVQKILRVQ